MKYINNFIEYKESKCEKAIYRIHDNTGNTYYSGDYVKWLEEQLTIPAVVGKSEQLKCVWCGNDESKDILPQLCNECFKKGCKAF